MRSSDSYRGARRNAAKADRPAARKEKRPSVFHMWRRGSAAVAANTKAKIGERAEMANEANKAVAKATVEAGPMASIHSVVNHAYLAFYRTQKRTRVVNRIIRQLVAVTRSHQLVA